MDFKKIELKADNIILADELNSDVLSIMSYVINTQTTTNQIVNKYVKQMVYWYTIQKLCIESENYELAAKTRDVVKSLTNSLKKVLVLKMEDFSIEDEIYINELSEECRKRIL